MGKLEELVDKGKVIKGGLKYIPAPPHVFRTFSEYSIHDHAEYSTWKNEAIIYLNKVLEDKDALQRFKEQDFLFEKNHFDPRYIDNMIGILNAYLELGITGKDTKPQFIHNEFKNVFIVHGHNKEVRETVARCIEKLGLHPIILQEQANAGKTIIEKFEEYAKKSNFAVILLTADDKIEGSHNFQARQNVIFEMGYFMGSLGRKNVMCLLEDGVQKPGDIDGVVYTPFDAIGGWKFSLVQELKNSGYNVDANKLVEL